MSKAASSRQTGDKVFVGGSPADRAVLISDIIQCMQQKAPKNLLLPLATLSEFLHQQPPLSPSNLYRKQYGNLEHAFSVDKAVFNTIFTLDTSVLGLKPMASLQTAAQAGHLSASLLAQCQKMHTFKRTHDLNTLKINDKNECKRCGEAYSTLINNQKLCGGQDHQPRFDFERHADPLQCEIP